ncbi:isochorismatase family protein [Paenibacillus elgii]|uniref:cysteine hydrolase family protein n=1 Tax=Paenibacillus elgii TaxID=189691 RepID=UPI002D7BAEBA|nr:isochorismatase family protein [Paenibacillus elgii]
MKIALLIVDMQTVFLKDKEQSIIGRACEYINYTADLLRSKGHLIVHIQDIEGRQESNKGLFEIIPEIKAEEQEKRVTKVFSNAFWKTDLEQLLLENEVGLVIVSGFAAEHCVLFTYNGARERGFKTVILQNGIIGERDAAVEATYRDRNIISYPVIESFVGG